MVVVENYTNSKTGNDCMIYDDISLVEMNNDYVVISSRKYCGWMGVENNISTYQDDYSLEEARVIYNKLVKESEG